MEWGAEICCPRPPPPPSAAGVLPCAHLFVSPLPRLTGKRDDREGLGGGGGEGEGRKIIIIQTTQNNRAMQEGFALTAAVRPRCSPSLGVP